MPARYAESARPRSSSCSTRTTCGRGDAQGGEEDGVVGAVGELEHPGGELGQAVAVAGEDVEIDALVATAGLHATRIGLTWLFNFLYGPVEVALPLHVTRDLRAGSEVLGLYWTVFGAGAIAGSLAAGSLRRLPLWPTTLAIVIGWGVTLLPFWADLPTAATVASFGLGGLIYGPFVALSITLVQSTAPPEHLSTVLAARGAALLTASPLGAALGGPLTAALGPRTTLGASGLATIVLGALAAAVLVVRAGRRRPGP